jgi:ParB/RepB/Spo0J family partition protein
MTKLSIRKIKVRNRYRKSLGDIESLAANIKELGLLHPIVVRPDGRLIAGERRMAACIRLGWKSVPVTYVDLKEVVRGELRKYRPSSKRPHSSRSDLACWSPRWIETVE